MKKIFVILLVLTSQIGFSQNAQNNGFELSCPDADFLPCDWELSWGKKDYCTLQKEEGNQYLSLSIPVTNAVVFVEQAIEIEETKEVKIITLNGRVRTKEFSGKGASLHIQLFDSQGHYVTKKDMGGSRSAKWIVGDTGWKSYSLQMACPVGIAKINIGAIIQGQGTADFDDFEVKVETVTESTPNEIAASYIEEVAKVIATHSLYKDAIDLQKMEEQAKWVVADAQTKKDCQLGVEYMLQFMQEYGDNHSFFMPVKEVAEWKGGSGAESTPIKYPGIRQIGTIGYISVPGFHSSNQELIRAYADSLQSGIKSMFNDELSGWIVDLRPNDGGNMEPMILGLGPLLDDVALGSLMDVNGDVESWYYKNGTYAWDEENGMTLEKPVKLSKKLPIAVLTSAYTGSSGEITTISFIGNTKTRSFGEATMGLTTGNDEFHLSDGSILFLASTYMVDRNGNIFKSRVKPDVEIPSTDTSDTDAVLEAAKQWIKEQQ